MCNPFTDKDVEKALDNPDVRNTPAQIYKSCSGGKGPNCGSCMCFVKDMIVDHQSALGVRKIIKELPELTEAETVAAR
jgi:bacterioferritin-associated ferredoxin